MDLVDSTELFNMQARDLMQLQLAAAQDLYRERREQIRVLDQRGIDENVHRVEKAEDIVPLLFSHTTYKSYPESFIKKRRWEQLTKWFQTLSALPVEVDMIGVETIDNWVDRMWDNGHYLYATSGTTGKCSFLNNSKNDRDFVERGVRSYWGWPNPFRLRPKRRYYQFFMGDGPQTPMHWFKIMADVVGLPNARFIMGREPVKVSQLNRIGAMRKAMAEGTASPDDISAFDDEMASRAAASQSALAEMARDMFEHRDEPMCVNGWRVMYDVTKVIREAGGKEGDFRQVDMFARPRKSVSGPKTPAEVESDAMRLFGQPSCFGVYGMTELSLPMPECEAGNYHLLPWIMVLVLDRNGNQLLDHGDGIVEGRAAFLDLSREARWGGVITGDKIQVNYKDKCACGRHGPIILQTVSRYSDSADDKVDCAGTFDAYVRGIVGE